MGLWDVDKSQARNTLEGPLGYFKDVFRISVNEFRGVTLRRNSAVIGLRFKLGHFMGGAFVGGSDRRGCGIGLGEDHSSIVEEVKVFISFGPVMLSERLLPTNKVEFSTDVVIGIGGIVRGSKVSVRC